MAHEIVSNAGDTLDESAIRTLLGRSAMSGYIAQGGVDVTYHGSDDTIDVSPGTAYVLDDGRDITIQADGWTGYGLVANAVNHVWIAVDPTAATDDEAVGLVHNTTGVAPSNPSIEIAEVDTNESGAAAVTPKSRGTAPALDGADITPRSVTTGDLSESEYYPESFSDIRTMIDAAKSAGGGTVHAPARVGTIDATIEVPPGVTLHLPAGCVIEPTGQFDMIQLRGTTSPSTEPIGRLIGPGLLRTRPDKLAQSSIGDFDGAAHVLVDGADGIRPSKDNPRNTSVRAVHDVRIMADSSATGGYGIHLKATGEYDYVWLQEFHAHVNGCEHAIRIEATGPNTATINGNKFYGHYTKPLRVVQEILGSPSANALYHNEYRGTGQATTAMDQMYHFEGSEGVRVGTDFDTNRPDTYVRFEQSTQGNYVGPETLAALYPGDISDDGERNTVAVQSETEFDSYTEALLSADETLSSGSWTKVPLDTVQTDPAGEFDTAAHEFVSVTNGTYMASAAGLFQSFNDGDFLAVRLVQGGFPVRKAVSSGTSASQLSLSVARAVRLDRDTPVWVEAYASNGATLDSDRVSTNLSVVKVN
jgi:hypothetical protein